ncbi:kynureninase [Marivita hallyeonensis]|uniref:Kynureninase n=1 Tax=Marivita hallyeonensis TaxID=996342 RepID=A0A1M5VNT1_9RHOB|nr:kynureninase [Marivita hallyeonensis]SHH76899.1 Kynureninase [Marivita hallyeonensis]
MTDFSATRAAFHIPDGVIYLDGNSLGPLPKTAARRVSEVVTQEWGDHLIKGWNDCGWMDMPMRLGDRIGRLIGAEPGHVVVGDTLSIKVFQALAAAIKLNPDRRVILSDTGNFPSDLYMAEGLISLLGPDYDLRLVAPEDVSAAITEEIAVTLITEVDYRTGRKHDMAALTKKARAHGVVTVWDLAHSAGAIPVDLRGVGADFAVGCTYKYLNGGPGAPAFIYVSPDHAEKALPALSGWLGHDSPFAFDLGYRAGAGVSRMRVGTPPIVQMAALEAALDIWDGVDLQDVRNRSIDLSERFVAGVEAHCPGLVLASPRDPAQRGSQVSFRFEHGYAAMQALIANGVIGDFRAPDMMRFGFAPLYLDEDDIDAAVDTLRRVITDRLWETPEFQRKKAVT